MHYSQKINAALNLNNDKPLNIVFNEDIQRLVDFAAHITVEFNINERTLNRLLQKTITENQIVNLLLEAEETSEEREKRKRREFLKAQRDKEGEEDVGTSKDKPEPKEDKPKDKKKTEDDLPKRDPKEQFREPATPEEAADIEKDNELEAEYRGEEGEIKEIGVLRGKEDKNIEIKVGESNIDPDKLYAANEDGSWGEIPNNTAKKIRGGTHNKVELIRNDRPEEYAEGIGVDFPEDEPIAPDKKERIHGSSRKDKSHVPGKSKPEDDLIQPDPEDILNEPKKEQSLSSKLKERSDRIYRYLLSVPRPERAATIKDFIKKLLNATSKASQTQGGHKDRFKIGPKIRESRYRISESLLNKFKNLLNKANEILIEAENKAKLKPDQSYEDIEDIEDIANTIVSATTDKNKQLNLLKQVILYIVKKTSARITPKEELQSVGEEDVIPDKPNEEPEEELQSVGEEDVIPDKPTKAEEPKATYQEKLADTLSNKAPEDEQAQENIKEIGIIKDKDTSIPDLRAGVDSHDKLYYFSKKEDNWVPVPEGMADELLADKETSYKTLVRTETKLDDEDESEEPGKTPAEDTKTNKLERAGYKLIGNIYSTTNKDEPKYPVYEKEGKHYTEGDKGVRKIRNYKQIINNKTDYRIEPAGKIDWWAIGNEDDSRPMAIKVDSGKIYIFANNIWQPTTAEGIRKMKESGTYKLSREKPVIEIGDW